MGERENKERFQNRFLRKLVLVILLVVLYFFTNRRAVFFTFRRVY